MGQKISKREQTIKEAGNTRSLTKSEKEKLGLPLSSRRRVRIGLKRVTKKTKLYTQEQYLEAKRGVSKASYKKARFETYKSNDGFSTLYYKDRTTGEIKRILAKHPDKYTQLVIRADHTVSTGFEENGVKYISTTKIPKGELLAFVKNVKKNGYKDLKPENIPSRFSVIIYEKD